MHGDLRSYRLATVSKGTASISKLVFDELNIQMGHYRIVQSCRSFPVLGMNTRTIRVVEAIE